MVYFGKYRGIPIYTVADKDTYIKNNLYLEGTNVGYYIKADNALVVANEKVGSVFQVGSEYHVDNTDPVWRKRYYTWKTEEPKQQAIEKKIAASPKKSIANEVPVPKVEVSEIKIPETAMDYSQYSKIVDEFFKRLKDSF